MPHRDPETGKFVPDDGGQNRENDHHDYVTQWIECTAVITEAAGRDANVQGDFNLTATGRQIDSDEIAELVALDREIHLEVVDRDASEQEPGYHQWSYYMAQDEDFGNELFQENPGEGEIIESGSAGTSGGSGTSDPANSQVTTRNGRLGMIDTDHGQKLVPFNDTTNGSGGGGTDTQGRKHLDFRRDLGMDHGPIFQDTDTLDVRLQYFRDSVDNLSRLVLRGIVYWKVHEGEVSIQFN